jgi:hypothetical protein
MMSGFTREQYGQLFRRLIQGYSISTDVLWRESLDGLAEPDTLLAEDHSRTFYITATRYDLEQDAPSIIYLIGLHKN